jgi:hypothetical protein
MDTGVQSDVFQYIEKLKSDLITNFRDNKEIITFIENYPNYIFTKNEISVKKKRIKNPIPLCEKCIAKRANGEQCSRRKKGNSDFCGTHIKGCPHGVIASTEDSIADNSNIIKKQIEVWLEDINGIMYWINDTGQVYNTKDILDNIENPRVIAHYEKITLPNGYENYKLIGEIH